MVRWGSALQQGVMQQLVALVGSVESMAAMGSALSTTALQPANQEEGAASMAVATGKAAKWKAAALLQ